MCAKNTLEMLLTVKEVLAITGTDTQKDPDSVKTTVTGWLNGSK